LNASARQRWEASRRHKVAMASDVVCMLRRSGPKVAFGHVFRYVSRPVYRHEDRLLLVKPLTAPVTVPPGALDIGVVPAEARHLAALTAFSRRHCRWRMLTRPPAEGGGADSVLGFVGDELMAQLWWVDHLGARRHIDALRLGLALEQDEIYAFDMFLAPEYRGHGNAMRFVSRTCELLAGLGYRRMWGFVEESNLAAKWLYATTGWETVGRVERRETNLPRPFRSPVPVTGPGD
jgi:GNAT superfamily N-acetyltransferase